MKAYIRARIAAGDTKSEIKAKLVDQFGPTVLAVPPSKGFDWLAWLLPLGGLALGAVVVGDSHGTGAPPQAPSDEPSADGTSRSIPSSSGGSTRSSPASRMSGTSVLVAFGAGFVSSSPRASCRSFRATSRPCRPSRPSGWASRARPGASCSRACRSSSGSAVFVVLGAGAAAIGSSIRRNSSCSSRSPASC